MISISRFTTEDPSFRERAGRVLGVLSARAGFVRGSVARCTDDPAVWVLVTEWQDVGSYRRGLSHYDVKVEAWPLLGTALPEPSGFEVIEQVQGRRAQSD